MWVAPVRVAVVLEVQVPIDLRDQVDRREDNPRVRIGALMGIRPRLQGRVRVQVRVQVQVQVQVRVQPHQRELLVEEHRIEGRCPVKKSPLWPVSTRSTSQSLNRCRHHHHPIVDGARDRRYRGVHRLITLLKIQAWSNQSTCTCSFGKSSWRYDIIVITSHRSF